MSPMFSKKQAASCLLVSKTHNVADIGYLPKNESYLPKNEDNLPNPPAGPDHHGAKKLENSKSPFQQQMRPIFSKKQAASCILVSKTHNVADIGYLPKRADVVHHKNEDYCEAYPPACSPFQFSQPHKCCVVDSRKRIFEDNLFSRQKRGQNRAKIAYPSCSSPCCIGKYNVPQDDPMSQEQQHELGFACSLQLEQILVKGFFGTISLQFNLENNALDLLNEVHQKIGFHASNHYLTCNHKVLEDHRALHEQGVSRNSHVYFNPRLHGGRKRLRRFLRKIGKFIASTVLPDGRFYPELKDNGCLILTSLVHCVTSILSCGKSWAREFSLDSFDVDGNFNVYFNETEELVGVNEGRIKQNLRTLAQIIKKTFQLDSKMPPYLSDLINTLENEVLAQDFLDEHFRYIIDKHISLMPSKNRESLIVQVKCLWDSLTTKQQGKFDTEVSKSTINSNWFQLVHNNPVFSITVGYAKNNGHPYGNTNKDAFTFIRNFITHGPDNSQGRSHVWGSKLPARGQKKFKGKTLNFR